MAIIKSPIARYQIINRMLREQDCVKTHELKRAVLNELGVSVTLRMINEDIKAMKSDPSLNYMAPIVYNHSAKAWAYSDPNYTISAFGLRDEDITALSFYAHTLNQYKEYEIFKDFSAAIEKVLEAVNIRKDIPEAILARQYIMTENTTGFSGSKWIPSIVSAISRSCLIKIDYQKFGDSAAKSRTVEPYLLKEDRHRWYVVVRYKGNFSTFGLDRISAVEVLKDRFQPVDFDGQEYFKHSFGVTVEGNVVEVILSFTPHQGNYIKSLPLHQTQEVLVDDENEFRISVKVRPTYEFYEKVLGYGAALKILSPPKIVQKYMAIIESITQKYF